jgi:Protein of unknown function (DUF1194)
MSNDAIRPAMHHWKVAFWAVVLLAAGVAPVPGPPPPPRPATQTDVAVVLVLALDTSGSVSNGRFELQKQGYAAAFRNPQVLEAIRSLGTQSIAVTMMQWTGPELHVVAVGWTLIKDADSANAFAAEIEEVPRQLFGGGTSISGAIDYSRNLLAQSPFRGTRRIIDISGDGSNNRGRPVTAARDEAVRDGIVINGLPILTLEPDLDRYYFANVIGGPGSFVVPVASYDNFADAVLKKLISEIAGKAMGAARTDEAASQTRPSLRQSSRPDSCPSLSAGLRQSFVVGRARNAIVDVRNDALRVAACAPFPAMHSIRRRWSCWRRHSTKRG